MAAKNDPAEIDDVEPLADTTARQARRVVAAYATDVDECRVFLAMLGIGPKLEQKLNSLGIWHYAQIAEWTQANVDWVNAAISFRGCIEREKWVSQARQLLQDAGANLEPAPEDRVS